MQLLNIFDISPGKKMINCIKYLEIYDRNKKHHFQNIKKKSGIHFEEMLFFDDMSYNISEAKSLGVVSVLCPEGFTQSKWKEGLLMFEKSKKKN